MATTISMELTVSKEHQGSGALGYAWSLRFFAFLLVSHADHQDRQVKGRGVINLQWPPRNGAQGYA